MRITSGRVVAATMLIEERPRPDGSVVTVLIRGADDTFELDLDAEAEILESIAEADGGDIVPAEQVLRTVRGSGERGGRGDPFQAPRTPPALELRTDAVHVPRSALREP